jgi:inorganic pyrophosphatase
VLPGSNEKFWEAVDTLVSESKVVIDRPKGTHHPRFPSITYPVDYGYLENTTSPDGGGIDVWRGTDAAGKIDAIICTIDLMKKDSEIKLLIGCTPDERKMILEFHNESEYMKGILMERG